MPLLALDLSDVFVLIGGAASALVTLSGLVFALTRYILSGIRKIAREENKVQNDTLAEMLKHLESVESQVGTLGGDVATLKGWTAGFTAGSQARFKADLGGV